MAKKVIHELKFTHARDSAKLIAHEMAALLPRPHDSAILVHIPTASSRVRLRGFDQSALISRELSRLSGIPHLHLVGRIGQERQVGTSGYQRRHQLQEVFRVLTPEIVKGMRVILVDDVLTTGSTLETAAKALMEAGALSVDAIVFAQAV